MQGTTQLRKNFNTGDFKIGAPFVKQLLWYFTDVFLFRSKIIPFSNVLVCILRLYGAKIGKDVRIKPGIFVRYPWKLVVGDHSWLADCYIDNLANVVIGSNCCISQNAVLISGNHNYKKATFDLITKSIVMEDGAWIGACAMVCPGVTMFSHSMLTLGSVAVNDLKPYKIHQGNPAVAIKDRSVD